MSTLEIIGVPRSSYVRVVRMACEEKGVPYVLQEEIPHSPAVNAIHPFGKVPVMRYGGVELYESKAIVTYIDRTCPGPKLIPDDPERQRKDRAAKTRGDARCRNRCDLPLRAVRIKSIDEIVTRTAYANIRTIVASDQRNVWHWALPAEPAPNSITRQRLVGSSH